MAWTVERVAEQLSIDTDSAARVIGIVHGTVSPLDYPVVADWVRQCYHEPGHTEQRMRAIDAELGTYGAEAIWGDSCTEPVAEYCNTGDSYAPTVLYDYVRCVYTLTTMGDFVERYEKRYGIR